MALPSYFSKHQKNRSFNYTPRYYDPKEEERKAREFMIERELALESGEMDANTVTQGQINVKAELRKKRAELKMKRGSFYRNTDSTLVNNMSERNDRMYRRNTSKNGQYMRTFLLAIMLGIVVGYVLELVSGFFAMAFLCIFMILFISKINSN